MNIGGFTTVGERTVIYNAPAVEGKAAPVVNIDDYVNIGAWLPPCVSRLRVWVEFRSSVESASVHDVDVCCS